MSEVDPERKRILARVLEKFSVAYGKEFDADKIRLWYHQTGHLNEDAALATADACIAHNKWMPTISEFLEVSRQVRQKQEAMSRQVPREMGEHIKALQDKGLKVQRDLLAGRSGQRHDHRGGWEKCPVCVQAHVEKDADECRCCFLLDTVGITPLHHV
jgi:hypothetical protein